MTESSLVVKSKDKTKIFPPPLVTLSLIVAGAIIVGTAVISSEMVNGQNATGFLMPPDQQPFEMVSGQNVTSEIPFEMVSEQMGYINTETNGTFTILGNSQRLNYQLNLSGMVQFN